MTQLESHEGLPLPEKWGMKSEQKCGTSAIKKEEINEEMDEKTEREGKTLLN